MLQEIKPLTFEPILIEELVTHADPHLDELSVFCMLKHWFPEEAECRWPGSSKAKIDYLRTGILPRGEEATDFPNRLFVGVARGELDEHHASDSKMNECAASLTAGYLSVSGAYEVRSLVNLIRFEDRHGGGDDQHIASLIKQMHRMEKKPSIEALLDWTKKACGAYMNAVVERLRVPEKPLCFQSLLQLMKELKMEGADAWADLAQRALDESRERQKKAREAAKNIELVPFGCSLGQAKMAVVHEGDDKIAGALKSRGAKLVIHAKKTGNVQLMSGGGLCLQKTAALIRAEELRLRGLRPLREGKLHSLDTLVEVPQWHLVHTQGSCRTMLFNGSYTAPEVEPTEIPLSRIIALAQQGLS